MSVLERGVAEGTNLVTGSHIQPFAALIAVTTDWIITHISENIDEYLDVDASVIGHTLDHVLQDEAVHDIRGILNATAGQSGMGRVLGSELRPHCGRCDLTVYVSDTGFILEIEPGEEMALIDDIGMVRGLIERVKKATTLEDVAYSGARSARALTGFDTVAVYSVQPDQSCRFIAQAHTPGAVTSIDANFSPEDFGVSLQTTVIPHLLMTADVDARGVALLSGVDQDALDLCHAISAAPTPQSTATLNARAAKASLTLPIVKNGTLAGLIFCSHQQPLRIGFRTRMLLGLFGDLFAYEFAEALATQQRAG